MEGVFEATKTAGGTTVGGDLIVAFAEKGFAAVTVGAFVMLDARRRSDSFARNLAAKLTSRIFISALTKLSASGRDEFPGVD